MASILPFDELNIFRDNLSTHFENGKIRSEQDKEDIIDEMLDTAKQYIVRLDASGAYEPITARLDYNVVLDFLDANLAGVRVTLDLVEAVGECVNG